MNGLARVIPASYVPAELSEERAHLLTPEIHDNVKSLAPQKLYVAPTFEFEGYKARDLLTVRPTKSLPVQIVEPSRCLTSDCYTRGTTAQLKDGEVSQGVVRDYPEEGYLCSTCDV